MSQQHIFLDAKPMAEVAGDGQGWSIAVALYDGLGKQCFGQSVMDDRLQAVAMALHPNPKAYGHWPIQHVHQHELVDIVGSFIANLDRDAILWSFDPVLNGGLLRALLASRHDRKFQYPKHMFSICQLAYDNSATITLNNDYYITDPLTCTRRLHFYI